MCLSSRIIPLLGFYAASWRYETLAIVGEIEHNRGGRRRMFALPRLAFPLFAASILQFLSERKSLGLPPRSVPVITATVRIAVCCDGRRLRCIVQERDRQDRPICQMADSLI